MPTLLNRTFALLNNIKPPGNSLEQINYTVTNPDIIHDLQPQPNTNNNDMRKPDISIWKAAELGDLMALQYYIHHTTSVDPSILVNTRDPDTDCTLLHLVISHNKDKNILPMIQLLLERGADATSSNIYNVQAIHMIPLHCNTPVPAMEYLLNYKASPNARDGDGWTPLHYAARFCNPPDPVLELLVNRGADINLADAGGKSPMFGLLANGDLSSTLDWFIHTVNADLSIRGDFLDPISRKTRYGSIVLQAAKYCRLDCLSLLIRSQTAIQQLKSAIDRDELEHANFLVKENKARLLKMQGSEQQISKSDMILQLLQELEELLESDPNSMLNNHPNVSIPKTAATPTVPNEPKNKVQRRHSSFMILLGSMRRKSSKEHSDMERKSSKSSLLRKMSHIIRRTKSENNGKLNDEAR